jgi:polar amino acid transport system substrate-binding protein
MMCGRLARLLALSLLVVLPFVVTWRAVAQQDATYERVMRDKTLRVWFIQNAPQGYLDSSTGVWKGFDADIYRYIASRLGVTLEPVATTSAAMVSMLSSGRADMGMGLYNTPERAQVIDFTIPYKWVFDGIVVNSANSGVKTVENLKGKTIGALRGSAEDQASHRLQDAGFAGDVRLYDAMDLMYRDLVANRIDALMNQAVYHQWVVHENPGLNARLAFIVPPKYFGQTGPSPSHLPLVKGAPRLADAVNKIILDMRTNGTFARIFAGYGITDPRVWTPPQ